MTDQQGKGELPIQNASPEPPVKSGSTRSSSRWQLWRNRILIALFLLGLGIIGLSLENVAPEDAAWYWGLVLPFFGVICVRLSTWKTDADQRLRSVIRQQFAHWIGFFLALNLMFILIYTGMLDRNSSGLVSLLLLAVASYYAGVYLERSFLLVSVILAIAVCVASYIEEYLWIVLVALGAVIAILLLGHRFMAHRKQATANTAPS